MYERYHFFGPPCISGVMATPGDVNIIAIEKVIPKNIGTAVGILCSYSTESICCRIDSYNLLYVQQIHNRSIQWRLSIKLKFFGNSLLVAYSIPVTSSPMMLRGCRACRATSSFRLPRANLTGRPAIYSVYSAARSSVCRVVLQIQRARHARLVADILKCPKMVM